MKRKLRETREKQAASLLPDSAIVKNRMATRTRYKKIGVPGYRVIRQKDPKTNIKSLLFEIDLPEILKKSDLEPQNDKKNVEKSCDLLCPKYRIMSTFEQ